MLTRENLYMRSEGATIPRAIWNALVDAVFAGRVTSVVGGKLSAGVGGGTALELMAGGAGVVRYQFQPYDIVIIGTNVSMRVRAGQLNEILPLMGDGRLGDDPAPSIPVTSGDLYLQIPTDDDGEPTEDVEVINGEMPEENDIEGGIYYHRLGIITVATVEGVTTFSYQPLVQTSLGFGLCGGVPRIVRA